MGLGNVEVKLPVDDRINKRTITEKLDDMADIAEIWKKSK